MTIIRDILSANENWATEIEQQDADYFERLSQGQSPKLLWIGCADSRVPDSLILGASSGDIFVHRNVANQANMDDPNCMSVVQYAVHALKVPHIVVCGHTCCGGVAASIENATDGNLHQWLEPIHDTYNENKSALDSITNDEDKHRQLSILNVKKQVQTLSSSETIQSAWQSGQELSIHGLLYQIESGRLLDLDMTCSG